MAARSSRTRTFSTRTLPTETSPSATRPRARRPLAMFAAATLALTACGGGNDNEATVPTLPPTTAPAEPVATTPDLAPAATDRDVVEPISVTPPTTTPTPTTTTPRTTTPPTAPPPPPDPVIVYSTTDDQQPFRVVDVAASDVLNVRSGPGVTFNIVDTLAPDAWFVQPTENVARVDGAVWRQVRTPAGALGWSHTAFLRPIDGDCSADAWPQPVESSTTTGDIDGDGRDDTVTLLLTDDGLTRLTVRYANGARAIRAPGRVAMNTGHHEVNSVDLDGDGRDEIVVNSTEGNHIGAAVFTFAGCTLVEHQPLFRASTTAGSPAFFGCTGVGTSDFQVSQITGVPTEDGIDFRVDRYRFVATSGFALVDTQTVADPGTIALGPCTGAEAEAS